MATAILKEIFEIELIRTRDEKLLGELDIVYDVGGGEFDHHGVDKLYRENGTPYAACGLIWKSFGKHVIHSKDPSLDEVEIDSVFHYVDRALIEGIDALDNGIRSEDGNIRIMNISTIISGFNPPWYSEKSEDEAFNEAVELTGRVLRNTIDNRFAVLKSRENILRAYKNRPIPEVLVLDAFCPWGEALRDIDEKNEVFFVVYPSKGNYAMQTIREVNGEDRKYLPKSWAGLRDEELAAVTGVSDAVFSHTGRFIAVAGSFEGIMKMAFLAISEPEDRKALGLFGFVRKFFARDRGNGI